MIQDVYQDIYEENPQLIVIDKGKQKEDVIQDEEVFLYKPYDILLESNKQKTPEYVFIQEEIDNLENSLKTL